MTCYLKPIETVRLMLTCRYCLQVTNSDNLWETVYKIQNKNNYLDRRFSLHTQRLIQGSGRRELAYKRLCGLLVQGRAPWKVKASVGYPAWYLDCCHGTILSNGNIAVQRQLDPWGSIWKPGGRNPEIFFDVSEDKGFSYKTAALQNGGLVTMSRGHKKARLWSSNGALVATLTGHGQMACFAVLSNGNIVTGSKNGSAFIWSPSGVPLVGLIGHTRSITCIAGLLSGDIVTGSEDGTAMIWSSDGLMIATLAGHTKPVTCVAALLNGNIVTGSEDAAAMIWSPAGDSLATLEHRLHFSIQHIAVLTSGNFATVNFNVVYIWSPDGHLIATSRELTAIYSIAALPGGSFVTGSLDNTAIIWSPTCVRVATLVGGRQLISSLGAFIGHKQPVCPVKVFPNGDILTGSLDGAMSR